MSTKRYAFFLMFPAIGLISFIFIFPIFYNFYLSFHRVVIYEPGMRFVGLSQYVGVLSDPSFFDSLRLSFIWTVGTVPFIFLLGLGMALLLAFPLKGVQVFRVLLFFPWIIPDYVAVIIYQWMYDASFGVFNYVLLKLNLISETIAWLGLPETAMFALIVLCIWKAYAFIMIMLLAGLQTLPKDLGDAAIIDGANRWQKFQYVTVPHLRPLIVISTLLMTLWVLKTVTLIYVATQGGPLESTRTLPVNIYNTAFIDLNFGESATLAIVLVGLLSILTIFVLRRERVR